MNVEDLNRIKLNLRFLLGLNLLFGVAIEVELRVIRLTLHSVCFFVLLHLLHLLHLIQLARRIIALQLWPWHSF